MSDTPAPPPADPALELRTEIESRVSDLERRVDDVARRLEDRAQKAREGLDVPAAEPEDGAAPATAATKAPLSD